MTTQIPKIEAHNLAGPLLVRSKLPIDSGSTQTPSTRGKMALLDKNRTDRLLGSPPWNRLHDAVRHTVHEIRKLCPENGFGSRSIARQMVRAGIQISRASIRRILEEDFVEPGRGE